jgi:hypothetical protein
MWRQGGDFRWGSNIANIKEVCAIAVRVSSEPAAHAQQRLLQQCRQQHTPQQVQQEQQQRRQEQQQLRDQQAGAAPAVTVALAEIQCHRGVSAAQQAFQQAQQLLQGQRDDIIYEAQLAEADRVAQWLESAQEQARDEISQVVPSMRSGSACRRGD